ncbi:MAG: hypothetical protein ACRDZO_22805 [Egibacteraceae bacterium]
MPVVVDLDRAAYDLAWLPAPFLPPDAVRQALPRLLFALRPGGGW